VLCDEQTGEEARFRMLETVREYALELLKAHGAESRTRDSHARHYLHLARLAQSELRGPSQLDWLNRLSAEQNSSRAALRWGLDSVHEDSDMDAADSEAESGLELGMHAATALCRFWEMRGY